MYGRTRQVARLGARVGGPLAPAPRDRDRAGVRRRPIGRVTQVRPRRHAGWSVGPSVASESDVAERVSPCVGEEGVEFDAGALEFAAELGVLP